MNNSMFRFFIIPLLVVLTYFIVQKIRNKFYKPTYEEDVQRPGKLERFIEKLFVFLTAIVAFFAVMGFIAQEMEMALVFGGLALSFLMIVIVLKRAYDISYYENEEYFILTVRNKEYQVYYENIIDWQPSFNEIAILDQIHSDKEYIRVNIKMFKPEILLRKIADLAFEGRFNNINEIYPEDPYREMETINYLVSYRYGYLVEDYLKKLENT